MNDKEKRQIVLFSILLLVSGFLLHGFTTMLAWNLILTQLIDLREITWMEGMSFFVISGLFRTNYSQYLENKKRKDDLDSLYEKAVYIVGKCTFYIGCIWMLSWFI